MVVTNDPCLWDWAAIGSLRAFEVGYTGADTNFGTIVLQLAPAAYVSGRLQVALGPHAMTTGTRARSRARLVAHGCRILSDWGQRGVRHLSRQVSQFFGPVEIIIKSYLASAKRGIIH